VHPEILKQRSDGTDGKIGALLRNLQEAPGMMKEVWDSLVSIVRQTEKNFSENTSQSFILEKGIRIIFPGISEIFGVSEFGERINKSRIAEIKRIETCVIRQNKFAQRDGQQNGRFLTPPSEWMRCSNEGSWIGH
jgi:hypothetical protein